MKEKKETGPSFFQSTNEKISSPDPEIIEVGLYYLHNDSLESLPYLMVFFIIKLLKFYYSKKAFLNNGDFIFYKCFLFNEENNNNRINKEKTISNNIHLMNIRFSKIEHDLITRNLISKKTFISSFVDSYRYPRIKPFDNIMDKRGVFLTGNRFVYSIK